MDITSFSHERIMEGLKYAESTSNSDQSGVRLLFSPKKITDQNFGEVCRIFANLNKGDYDTVVVIESHPGSAEKKLPMPSFKYLDTSLGRVYADDKLRNDFADEDDDFFINDDAFDQDASLWHQLMMLQCTLEDFQILSIQITDENSAIVKELAFALEEILANKNTLIICCCDLPSESRNELRNVLEFVKSDNISALMNYLNGDSTTVTGVGTFITGLLVSKNWELHMEFPILTVETASAGNTVYGYAALQQQTIYQT